ncbi:hypothetical protein ACNFBR_24255 [Pseudomonas sp. NY11955]|uniref:hypothetical protein n=1 Tax=Pseudomonas sp. NY11955 TaxID=3400363 RepID=UPI003A8C23CB
MAESNEGNSATYNMNGWRAHLRFDPVLLNAELERRYSSQPDQGTEKLDFFSSKTSSVSRNIKCEFGKPLLIFPEDGASSSITVARRLFSYASYVLERKLGYKKLDVQEISAQLVNERLMLFSSVLFEDCRGVYSPGAPVCLQVKELSGCAFGYLASTLRDEEAALPFRIRFNELPDADRVIMLNDVFPEPGSEWLMRALRFSPRKVVGSKLDILYIAYATDSDGTFPAVRADENILSNGAQYDDPWLAVSAFIDGNSLPAEGYRNSDFASLATLVFPRGRVIGAGLTEIGESYIYEGKFQRPPSSSASDAQETQETQETQEAWTGRVDPLVSLVYSGGDAVALRRKANTEEQFEWVFEGVGLGGLKPAGSSCDYVPPAVPDVERNLNADSREPPVRRSSTELPVTIDRVRAGPEGSLLVSTLVVKKWRQTNYFELEKSGAKLKLNLWRTKKDGTDHPIAPENITWHRLVGDGRVTQEGVFTPGIFTRYSVLLAIENNDQDWFWAVIIIPVPFMSVDEFIDLRQEH